MENPLTSGLETSEQKRIANIGIPPNVFMFLLFQCFLLVLKKKKMVFGLCKPDYCAVCIMGDLARGGSVAVTVGVSDRWQVTCDT